MSRVLHTKDGRQIGNAIIIKEVEPSTESMKSFLAIDNYKVFLIETDFGNRMKLTWKEIVSQFELGPKQSYKVWAADRADLRKENKLVDEKSNPDFVYVPLDLVKMTIDTFREYQASHEAKGTPDGDNKALRNKAMAELWEKNSQNPTN